MGPSTGLSRAVHRPSPSASRRRAAGSPAMTLLLGKGRSRAAALVSTSVLAFTLSLVVLVLPALTAPATAATPLTVSQAIGQQTGSSQTVRGYVVGQPTATSTVVRSGFPSDYALAIADSPSQTSTSSMLYVQVPSAFRAQWGLKSNPSLLGRQIDVTGALAAYFSHPGMTGASAFADAGTGGPDRPAADRRHRPVGLHLLRPGDRQDRHRAAHVTARHHRRQHPPLLRPGLDRPAGHRPGPRQPLQRHRALHRSLDRQEQQRRRQRPVEP